MIRLIKPYISFDEVKAEFEQIFDSGILTRGQYSASLPREMCEYTGARYAFNATSATTALSAALEAVGVGVGDEVVVSDFSFPASANVVEAIGATSVLADVSRDTYNMLPEELDRKITTKTKAVIFVCALGNPSGLDVIADICKQRSVPLINDAACAIGSSVDGVMVGNITDIECFSFHPRKLLTAGEGGSITTNNSEYAKTLEVKLMHGADVSDGHMDFVTYGFNYRLPELQSVMVIKQLKKLDDIIKRRIETREIYRRELEILGFTPQKHDDGVVHNYQSVVFTVPTGVDRDKLISALRADGIETVLGTYCLSNCTYYKKKYNDIQPGALWLERNTITLPCYDGIDEDAVIRAIRRHI